MVSQFGLDVAVYDYDGINLLTAHGPFTITLSLSPTPTPTLSGTTSKSTSSGQVSFSSLQISSPGSFTLISSSPDFISDSYSTLSISPLSLFRINLIPSTFSPSLNFDFTVTANLFDQVDQTWTGLESLTLSGDFDLSPQTKSTNTGSASFTLSGRHSGSLVLTCVNAGGTVQGQVTVNVLKNKIVISSVTPEVREI